MMNARYIGTRRIIPFLIVACSLAFPARAQYGGGTGEPNDPHLIYTAEPNDWDKHFKLMADIDLDPNLPGGRIFTQVLIAPLGPWGSGFTGDFDGNGHRLINLALEQKPNGGVGLFGVVEESGAIHDLTLEDVVVEGEGEMGALTAYNHGTIKACHVSGVVRMREVGCWVGGLVGLNEGVIEGCSMTGEVTSALFADWMGGLVGQNNGVLIECVAHADVSVGLEGEYVGGLVGTNRGQIGPCDDTGISHCYRGEISHCFATSTVSCTGCPRSFGGLVGQNVEGKISDSCATGDVCGGSFSVKLGGLVGSDFHGTIERCCATGNVSGGDDSLGLGGLAGTSFGIVTDCYATGDVFGGDGSRYVGGLIGHTLWQIFNCHAVGRVRHEGSGESIGGLVGSDHSDDLTYQGQVFGSLGCRDERADAKCRGHRPDHGRDADCRHVSRRRVGLCW
ncbi:MAG: hypothetical protein JW741_23480 [Sedimentisphaerales bacterium]|nr:hypothetical protein [Sedimentisphaerales bacterium]